MSTKNNVVSLPAVKPVEVPEMIIHGPVEISVTLHVMAPQNNMMVPARMTVQLPMGVYPSREDLQTVVSQALTNEPGDDGKIPAGTRPMTRREFWNHITKRETGKVLPMVGPDEFNAIHN